MFRLEGYDEKSHIYVPIATMLDYEKLIMIALNTKQKLKEKKIINPDNEEPLTYLQIVDEYNNKQQLWASYGIDRYKENKGGFLPGCIFAGNQNNNMMKVFKINQKVCFKKSGEICYKDAPNHAVIIEMTNNKLFNIPIEVLEHADVRILNPKLNPVIDCEAEVIER